MRPDTMTRSRPADPGAAAWGQRRLMAALGVAVLVATLVLTGLGYAVYYALGATSATAAAVARSTQARTAGRGDTQPGHPAAAAGTDGAAGAGGVSRRDAIAARPMLAVDPAAGRSGIPAAVPAPGICDPGRYRDRPVPGADRVPADTAGRGRAAGRDRDQRAVRHVPAGHPGGLPGVGAARRARGCPVAADLQRARLSVRRGRGRAGRGRCRRTGQGPDRCGDPDSGRGAGQGRRRGRVGAGVRPARRPRGHRHQRPHRLRLLRTHAVDGFSCGVRGALDDRTRSAPRPGAFDLAGHGAGRAGRLAHLD